MSNSNRINAFNNLTTILDAAATNGYSKNDMIEILGIPNKESSTQLHYWLQNTLDKSTIIININETTKQVTGYSISN